MSVAIEELLVNSLINKGLTITAAESCTGGLIASRIVNVSGASKIFGLSFVTYSNEAKSKELNIDMNYIDKYSVYSANVAKKMAEGAAKRAGSDVAISVTGVAGPTSDDPLHPVGLCYIGCYFNGNVTVKQFNFEGDRSKIRNDACEAALLLAYEAIQ